MNTGLWWLNTLWSICQCITYFLASGLFDNFFLCCSFPHCFHSFLGNCDLWIREHSGCSATQRQAWALYWAAGEEEGRNWQVSYRELQQLQPHRLQSGWVRGAPNQRLHADEEDKRNVANGKTRWDWSYIRWQNSDIFIVNVFIRGYIWNINFFIFLQTYWTQPAMICGRRFRI